MVVPDQLIEAKSQFRVLKDNQYMMPVWNYCKTLFGKHTVAASTTFYLMVFEANGK
jgi:hypothetical protein